MRREITPFSGKKKVVDPVEALPAFLLAMRVSSFSFDESQ